MASVKTKEEVPKERIMDVMEVVRNLTVEAPVTIGQVLVEDCAGTVSYTHLWHVPHGPYGGSGM